MDRSTFPPPPTIYHATSHGASQRFSHCIKDTERTVQSFLCSNRSGLKANDTHRHRPPGLVGQLYTRARVPVSTSPVSLKDRALHPSGQLVSTSVLFLRSAAAFNTYLSPGRTAVIYLDSARLVHSLRVIYNSWGRKTRSSVRHPPKGGS